MFGDIELRLDASYYSQVVKRGIAKLEQSGMRLVSLETIVRRTFMPGRFARVYVSDPEHGIPLLQGSHVVQFQPADIKYLSRTIHDSPDLILRSGWLLVTRSGSVGRVTMCPDEWDGWAGSDHIIRIVPNEEACPSGYLCAFLTSPIGRLQLDRHIHGGQIDEITVEHVEGIKVPMPRNSAQLEFVRTIDSNVRNCFSLKTEAEGLFSSAINAFQNV